jgi:hypothetical protein
MGPIQRRGHESVRLEGLRLLLGVDRLEVAHAVWTGSNQTERSGPSGCAAILGIRKFSFSTTRADQGPIVAEIAKSPESCALRSPIGLFHVERSC